MPALRFSVSRSFEALETVVSKSRLSVTAALALARAVGSTSLLELFLYGSIPALIVIGALVSLSVPLDTWAG